MYKEPRYPKYSQLKQDEWVIKQSSKPGFKYEKFFVEVGAHDGLTFSNTVRLEELGWNGLCIEPNPELYSKLEVNRRCEKSSLAVHGVSGELVPFQCSGLYGGMVEYLNPAEAKQFPGEIINVSTITLDEIMTQNNCPTDIAYISLDTEGNELEILKAFPFDKWNVGCWTVEHNDHVRGNIRRSSSLIEIFSAHGYFYVVKQFDIWFYKQ